MFKPQSWSLFFFQTSTFQPWDTIPDRNPLGTKYREEMYYFNRVCLSAVYKPDNWGVVSNMLTHRKISHKIQIEIGFLYVHCYVCSKDNK